MVLSLASTLAWVDDAAGMNKMLTETSILIATLALCVTAHATEAIQLDELIDTVKSTHPLFSRESRRADIERQLQARAAGGQDWRVFSSATYIYQEPVQTSPFVPKRLHDTGLEVGVERPIWETGGKVSASWSGGYLDQRVPGFTVAPLSIPADHTQRYRTGAFVSYSQPLWRNLGGLLNRLDYDLAAASVKIVEVQAIENQEVFLLRIAGQYVEWATLLEEARVTRERLTLAEAQLEQTRKKRRANLVDQADVLRAVDAVQTAKQAVYLVESQANAKRAELAVLAQMDNIKERQPGFDLYATTDLPEPAKIRESLRVGSRLIEALTLTAEQVGIQLGGAEEAIHPDLLLNVGFGLREDDDSVGHALGVNKPDAFVGLTFSYPLGNHSAEAEVERHRLLQKQVADRMQEVALQLDSSLQGLLIQLRELQQVLKLNEEQIASATQKTTEEIKLYNQGRGQLTFVIASRDDVQRAKLNYARNAARYQQLLLRYRELTDELLPNRGGSATQG